MLKIAHRGASGYALENSFEAFDKAIEFNVDMLECDVRVTKDKKLILMHDKRIDRTSDGNGRVSEINLSEFKEIKLENGQDVPTLEHFILRYKGKVKMMWDVKINGVAPKLVNLIKKYKIHDSVVVCFVYGSLLLDLLIRDSEIQTAIYFDIYSYIRYIFVRKLFVLPAKLVGANIVSLHYRFVDKKIIDLAHKNNLKIYVFSPSKKDDINKLKSFAVDGIISNYPDRI